MVPGEPEQDADAALEPDAGELERPPQFHEAEIAVHADRGLVQRVREVVDDLRARRPRDLDAAFGQLGADAVPAPGRIDDHAAEVMAGRVEARRLMMAQPPVADDRVARLRHVQVRQLRPDRLVRVVRVGGGLQRGDRLDVRLCRGTAGSDHAPAGVALATAIAAPTMPASFCRTAGTMRARMPVSSGTHFSDSLLIPPPTMNRSGDSSASMCCRYTSTRPAHLPQLMSCSSLACSDARFSASLPSISMWPNSVFGTSVPSMNSALPIPVPSVSISTVPCSPTPAPNFISAIPAASASFSTCTGLPAALANSARASKPTQAGSRLAAVLVTPLVTTPGNVMPIGPDHSNEVTSWLTTSATASGTAGCGVAIFFRSASSFPAATSTGAPLMPVPPISMPSACIRIPYWLVLGGSAAV